MLTDLCCPSRQFLALFFPVEVIIFHFYFLVSCCFADTIQRQTPFFCLIHITLGNNHGIKHHNIYKSHIHNDDVLLYTNHFVLRTQSRQSPNIHASMAAWLVATAYIRSHTNTPFPVCLQSVLQIFSNLNICFRSRFRWLT